MPIYVNNKKIKTFKFPGGECSIKLPDLIYDLNEPILIIADLFCSDDIMNLLLTVNAIRKENANTEIFIHIPYFPYARQDRVCNKGEAFSLEVMCNLINSLNCKITTIDIHSDVAFSKIENLMSYDLSYFISDGTLDNVINKIIKGNYILVCPDKGAIRRVEKFRDSLKNEYAFKATILYLDKKRNSETGEIKYEEPSIIPFSGNYMIIDDICDGGSTFIQAAKLISKKGNTLSIDLLVSHGIFSNGYLELEKYFNEIHCINRFY